MGSTFRTFADYRRLPGVLAPAHVHEGHLRLPDHRTYAYASYGDRDTCDRQDGGRCHGNHENGFERIAVQIRDGEADTCQ